MILLNDDNRHRDFTGVTRFHNAGYFGERVNAASGETWDTNRYNPDNLVRNCLKDKQMSDEHPINTAATFFQVAPKAHLFMLYSIDGSYGSGDNYNSKFFNESIEIIEKYNITNMFTSLNCSRHTKFFEDLKNWYIKHPNFKPFWCAGNDSSKKYNPIMEIEEVIGVAAYTLMVNGTVNPAYYSSISDYVDFSAPSMIYLNPQATKPDAATYSNSGTSFSTPWLCGMSCLVDDFFIDKKGLPLTREGMIQFFKDNCKDIGDKGVDPKTGFGAVILPEPNSIDIDKYYNIGRTNMSTLDKFKDKNDISNWAKASVEWAVNTGILQGDDKGYLLPKAYLTREQMAVMLERFKNTIK